MQRRGRLRGERSDVPTVGRKAGRGESEGEEGDVLTQAMVEEARHGESGSPRSVIMFTPASVQVPESIET